MSTISVRTREQKSLDELQSMRICGLECYLLPPWEEPVPAECLRDSEAILMDLDDCKSVLRDVEKEGDSFWDEVRSGLLFRADTDDGWSHLFKVDNSDDLRALETKLNAVWREIGSCKLDLDALPRAW